MILPQGVDKRSGLRYALDDLGTSHRGAVGIGDAENDHALFDACTCAVAVANAHRALRERANVVTVASGGRGVLEIIDTILAIR
jgi:hydroxymethylpyrimidine pyrophosphatase-like HAD family hydrolase